MSDGMSGRSSLIGVAISLSGNVLISLALNCQKLAHIRLQQEQEQQRGQVQKRGGQSSHGRQDQGVSSSGDGGNAGHASGERSALLGPTQSRKDGDGYGTLDGEGGADSPSSTSSGTKHDQRRQSASEQQQQQQGGNGPQENAEGDAQFDSSTSPSTFSTDFLKSRLWWLGIGLMTLGEFGNFLSYGFAPASLVAPLGAVALLSNVIFSPILLKERFQPSDLGGIFLAIVGAVTVVFSSKQSDAVLSPDELWEAISRTEFIVYAAITISLVGLLAWGSSTRLGDRYILLDVGVCALFGGFTVLSTKGLSSFVSQMGPFELLRYPVSYVLIAVLVGTALAQITYLNRALQRFDSREVIPTQFVMFTISAITGSAILYRDFANTEIHRVINFFFGCATTFAGVFLLTRNPDEEEDIETDHDEEHGLDSGEGGATVATDGEAGSAGRPLAANRNRVRLQDGAVGQPSAQKRRLAPTLAAVPVYMPEPRGGVRTGFGNMSRRRPAVSIGGLSEPSVPTRRRAAGGGASALATSALDGSEVPAVLSNSLQDEARSMPVVYARRSIFNPAFAIAYVDPTRSFGSIGSEGHLAQRRRIDHQT